MKSLASSGTSPENTPCLQWGLNREVTPSFGARLVQEGNRLHYLADRAEGSPTMLQCASTRHFRS